MSKRSRDRIRSAERRNFYRLYRPVALALAVIFAAVGLLFLFYSDGVLAFFNNLSRSLNWAPTSEDGIGFYLILAVGYMYLVTLLAFQMYRQPENTYAPFLLLNAKAASALLSFALAIFNWPYLIYLANGVVDGLIAVLVFFLYRRLRRLA